MSNQFFSLLPLSRRLTGTVAANRFVSPTGLQVVADGNSLGVARTAGVTNDVIPVDSMGTAILEAGAAFAEGATLKSDALGRGITWATSGGRLAVALEAAAAAGQFVEVRLLDNAA